jgi:hypothetical protein
MSVTFVVKFFNLSEATKEEFEYSDLLSALRVAKETEFNNQPILSDKRFEDELIILLTQGFVYAGPKSSQFPEGEIVIMLVRRDETNKESFIYGVNVVPFVAGAGFSPTPPVANNYVPAQTSWDPVREKRVLLLPVANTDDANIVRGED